MEKHKIKSYIKQIRGVSYKPDDLCDVLDNSSVILLRANNIEDGIINFDSIQYVSKSKVSSEQYLKKGDILICASSGSKNLVGKAASFDFDIECTFGAFCKVIRPKDGYSQYLSVFFQSQSYRQKISEFAIGANINNIRNEHIDELYISMYPESERYFIVKKINTVQSIISWRKNMIKKLDELIKARFVEMFGDLVVNPYKWTVVKLSDISLFLKSGLSRRLSDVDIGLPVIRSGNIQNGQFVYNDIKYWYKDDPQGANTEDYRLENGDILVNFINSASQIGKTAIFSGVNRECIYTTNILRMKLTDSCNIYYYNWFAMSDYYYMQLRNIIQPAVNQASFTTVNFLKLNIPLPPLQLQNQFETFVHQVNKSKVEVQRALDEAQLLFDSLMQKYFG